MKWFTFKDKGGNQKEDNKTKDRANNRKLFITASTIDCLQEPIFGYWEA